MLDLIVVALLQVVAGEPSAAPAETTAPAAAAEGAENTQATPPATTPATQAALHCRSETPTGSRLPIRRCTTARQDENNGASARQMLQRIRPQGQAGPSDAGG